MAFNPFNLFKGNPKVLELINGNKNMQELLLEQAFVSQFKKSENEPLQSYMNYERYEQLITYITIIQGDQSNKNRAFKFPYVSSEILSVNNELTFKFLLSEVVFTEEIVEQEIEVEKEIDSESSDRSYSSIKSSNSNHSKKEIYENKQYQQADKQNFVLREENDKTLTQYQFKDESNICEQDFPDVKHKKVITVREIIKKTIKKPYQPLIFKLLAYFQSKSVVHILDGYICRVLDNVINNRLVEFLEIVNRYHSLNKIKRIFSHLQSNSVQQFLLNFINKLQESQNQLATEQEAVFTQFIQKISQIPCCEWPKNQSVLQEKTYILQLYFSIAQKIYSKVNSKISQYSNEKSQNSTDKQSFVKIILNESRKLIKPLHISKLIQILRQTTLQPSSVFMTKLTLYYSKLVRFILMNYSLIKNLEAKYITSQEQSKMVKTIVQSCEDCFDPIIQISYSYIFEDLLHFDKQDLNSFKFQKSLISKMEFIDILGILAKQNIYFSKRTIIDHLHFQYLLKILDLYPKSSILHNGIMHIILPFIKKQNEGLLIEKFFQKQKLLLNLFEIAKSDSELRYQKKDHNRKCYISQATSVCLAIEKMQSEDINNLNQYKQSEHWQFIRESLIEDQKGLKNKILGGHQKLRDKKPLIFFTKEQCLENFKYFLSGVKLNFFDDFQNYEPNNSDSEDEQDHKEKQRHFFSEQIKNVKQEEENQPPQDDSKYFAQDYIL